VRPEFYDEYNRIENTHWWFLGRRRIFLQLLSRHLPLRETALILDVGCGTGTVLGYLSPYGRGVGVDVEQSALEYAQRRGVSRVVQAAGTSLAFSDDTFDLICALDILEHVDDDASALRECHRTCKPGGLMLLTVPAYRFLWGRQDEISRHRRRYVASDVRQRVTNSGFSIRRLTYFNTILFPIIAGIRLLRRWRGPRPGETLRSDFSMTQPGRLNDLLATIFAGESFLLPYTDLPFGVSLLCVAEKKEKPRIHADERR
jgi:SAM-dependent methyltransferase